MLAFPSALLADDPTSLAERLEAAPRVGGDDRYIEFSPFVQFDGGWASSSPDDAIAEADRRNGQVRRGRLYTDFAYDSFGGRFTIDFEALKTTPITYAYLSYSLTDTLTVQGGQQTVPFSLQQIMGSRSATFAEDGLNSSLQLSDSVGLAALSNGERWSVQSGVFGGDINRQPFDDGITAVSRGTWAPYLNDGDVLHFGLGLAAGFDRQEWLSFSGGVGSDLVDVSPISTGSFEQSSDLAAVNAELAATSGRLTWQSEYTVNRINSADRDAVVLHGGYMSVLAFLTDDHRDYDAQSGAFEQVKPERSIWDRGFGAFEVGARLGYLDFTDDPSGGAQLAATAVVNWYPTDVLRFTATHAHTRITDGPDEGQRFDATLLRAAIIY